MSDVIFCCDSLGPVFDCFARDHRESLTHNQTAALEYPCFLSQPLGPTWYVAMLINRDSETECEC
jgi:hypothetical protein